MKKRIASLLISLAIIIGVLPTTVLAETSTLENKAVYYTAASDYKSGDCILTATKMMIRRGMILNNTGDWNMITNKLLRGPATIFGLLLNSFQFDAEGLVFGIDSGKFTGKGNAARIKEFETLLVMHPEGIVVHGTNAASSGTHGVLVVKVENGVVYAADSSRNTGLNNMGIQEWKNTTMLDPSKVTKYWYISQISRSTQTIPSSTQSVNEEIMLGRIDQQIKVNKIMVDIMANQDFSNKNPRLRKYMIIYLDKVTTATSALLSLDGSKEAVRKKKAFWRYVKSHDAKLFYRLRKTPLGMATNLPGKSGRMITKVGAMPGKVI